MTCEVSKHLTCNLIESGVKKDDESTITAPRGGDPNPESFVKTGLKNIVLLPVLIARLSLILPGCLGLLIPEGSVFAQVVAQEQVAVAQPGGKQVLHGHVLSITAGLQPVDRMAPSTRLGVIIGLPLRNKQEADNLFQQIYEPASPNFHQYLTPDQFANRFGPSEKDYQALIDFAKANSLDVTGTHPNRTLLDVSGTVAQIEKLFHLTLRVYQHPTESRTFFAPDVEPSLDLDVPILHISGLDDYIRPQSNIRQAKPNPQQATPQSGSGTNGSYMGYDVRAAYVPGVTLTGAGQAVGLAEFDGYYPNDIIQYETMAGLPQVLLTNVLLDGFNGTAGIGNNEVALDIEMAVSMAPGLSQILVYEATNGTLVSVNDDVLNRMATDDLANQLSCSWSFGIDANTVQIFQQFATQGQSFFNSSGDSGAYVGTIPSPCDDPYITIVGGTTLTTSGPGGSWISESVWNWYTTGQGSAASSGGISTTYSIPTWQQGTDMSANRGSTNMRNIPDVAMVADNILVVADNGKMEPGTGGTSAAAPLWAGFTALVNQQAASNLQARVGFLNPAIYAIGQSTNYASCFHDITTGNNTHSASPDEFFAVPGYDLCTGWGTCSGSDLINALQPTNVSAVSILYSFTNGTDGANPGGVLILSSNTLYGMAQWGGSFSNGTVFAVNTDGTGFTNLYSFTGGSDGAQPVAGLILSGNTLYGTAYRGGTNGSGTVFALNTNGTGFTTLHSFTVPAYGSYTNSDGAVPCAGLILSGNTLFGTAYEGGSFGKGTVFAVNTNGTGFTTLHSFTALEDGLHTNSDGAYPVGGLILAGNTLYGTASEGGTNGCGTVFAVNTDGTGFMNLHSFTSDGDWPGGGLILSGNILYGTASIGGSFGNGTVFAVNTDGTGFTTLHNFTAYSFDTNNGNISNSDGAVPCAALILSGNTLYGTAEAGGPNDWGTVFAVNTDGTGFTTLHSFTSISSSFPYTNSDGGDPDAGFILAGKTLYGTATRGGSAGFGVVFSLKLGPGPPYIISQATSQYVALGANATFTFTATGAPTLTYQWRFNGTNLPGATTSVLAITNAQMANAGNYFLVVTNSYGSVTSSVVTLSVVPWLPFISNAVLNSNGSSVTLNFVGVPNSTNRVWITTNLNPPTAWQVLCTNISGSSGQCQFTESSLSNYSQRFYRVSTP